MSSHSRGSTGSGKSNTVYHLLEEANCNFLVVEPAKGEYKDAIGEGTNYFGTNYMMGDILRVNPFVFPSGIHVYEHIDRILEDRTRARQGRRRLVVGQESHEGAWIMHP